MGDYSTESMKYVIFRWEQNAVKWLVNNPQKSYFTIQQFLRWRKRLNLLANSVLVSKLDVQILEVGI